MKKPNLREIKDVYNIKYYGENAFCPYCKQNRRFAKDIFVSVKCKKCNLYCTKQSTSYYFNINLLHNDKVTIVYNYVLSQINFNKFFIYSDIIYNFKDKKNSSFEDFIEEIKKAKKYKKLAMFLQLIKLAPQLGCRGQ